jgi:hypothetical protein
MIHERVASVKNGAGAYIPYESLGTGFLAEKQFWCTIPSCMALHSRKATRTKSRLGTAHEKSANTPLL